MKLPTQQNENLVNEIVIKYLTFFFKSMYIVHLYIRK